VDPNHRSASIPPTNVSPNTMIAKHPQPWPPAPPPKHDAVDAILLQLRRSRRQAAEPVMRRS